ncbi:MAG: nucleotidyltransferase domain-containing protein, partial [Oryzihumus sp.]
MRSTPPLPGACLGLYLTGSVAAGDFHPHASDVDAVVVLDAVPQDCSALQAIHEGIAGPPAYDVVYLTPADLAGDPGAVTRAPGTLDGQWREGPVRAHVSPVTWAEMERYAVPVRPCAGLVVDDDHDRLVAFTRRNLEDYWAPLVDGIEAAAPEALAEAAVWTVLGMP